MPPHVDPDLGLDLEALGVADSGSALPQARLEVTLSLTVGELVRLVALATRNDAAETATAPAAAGAAGRPLGAASAAALAAAAAELDPFSLGLLGPNILEAVTQAVQLEQQHQSGGGGGGGGGGGCGLSLGKQRTLSAVLAGQHVGLWKNPAAAGAVAAAAAAPAAGGAATSLDAMASQAVPNAAVPGAVATAAGPDAPVHAGPNPQLQSSGGPCLRCCPSPLSICPSNDPCVSLPGACR